MIRRPPRSTRTDTLFPYTTLFRSTEVLIRNQIQSENFSVDPETGVSGWQIKRDGTATFNNLVIGGSNYIIDANGDAVFHSITLTADDRSEEHTSELQSLMRISYAGFCLKKKNHTTQ